ncbi:MAG: ATP-binding protein [Syntrophales bacterium]
MMSVIRTCQPRQDILSGTFNPEIFTASLSQVMETYRGKTGVIHNLYTDADQFFRDATYPTEGLRLVLADAFGRLSGDHSLPSVHRLETAFGGGKTHTLIALIHLGFKGKTLGALTEGIIAGSILPDPGEVAVVGIAGDEIPVHKPRGAELVPYTLWGEIAWQIGGETLYRELEAEVASHAAPGKNFLERVFAGRKVLLLLDELAQYAARLEAARPDGADQLAAFLMSLHGHARTHGGISIVLSLASQSDAFARQTQSLKESISFVVGKEVSEAEAAGIVQKAQRSVQSVVSRDAITVIPVQAAEISRILAQRLLVSVDQEGARATVAAYQEMYAKNASVLPDRVAGDDYAATMLAHFPFHPTLLTFLNNKLAAVENFQGTRGVLRVLALALRSIWEKKMEAPMIHTCHLDLREAKSVAEIISRTGSADLLAVLNTDVGGVDTELLTAGRSNAELLDRANPHPHGFPLYEYTWKTVFLHSLVGRAEGMGSNLFGILKKDTLLETALPGMSPPQIETALDAVKNEAFYLRQKEGRFFASLDPTITLILSRIRRSLDSLVVRGLVQASARKVVSQDTGTFQVVHDVSDPEHVPDKQTRPQLAILDPYGDVIDPDAFVTTAGLNKARIHQNLVFLLVPEIIRCRNDVWNEERTMKARETINRLEDLARDVLAHRILNDKPENHGITRKMLEEDEFKRKLAERENALVTTMTHAYDSLWFPASSGQVIRKEIKTGGGEGGASVIEEIRQVLKKEGELISTDLAVTQEGVISLGKLFFDLSATPEIKTIGEQFLINRRWPILEQSEVLEQIVRSGVRRGTWCLFRFDNPEALKPEHLYGRDSKEAPFELDLTQAGWSLVTYQGACQRGWIGAPQIRVIPQKVKQWIAAVVAEAEHQALSIEQTAQKVVERHGDIPDDGIMEAVRELIIDQRLLAYQGRAEQQEKPQILVRAIEAMIHPFSMLDIAITPAEASKRGWISPTPEVKEREPRGIILHGSAGARKIAPLLGRLGNLYIKGAASKIDILDISDLEVADGCKLRIALENASPQAMKSLAEFFEVLQTVAKPGDRTEADLEIREPVEDCLLVNELNKQEDV